MSMSDEIRARVDAKFKEPEFIGHLMETYFARQMKRDMKHVPTLEGEFGRLMRQYVRSKNAAHRCKRRADLLDNPSWRYGGGYGGEGAPGLLGGETRSRYQAAVDDADYHTEDAKRARARAVEVYSKVDYGSI